MNASILVAAATAFAFAGLQSASAQPLCPGLTGSARTSCLQRESAIAQSIAKDRNDAAKAYDTAYKAAVIENKVIKGAARVVPGGGAVYSGAQAATNAVIAKKKK